MAKVFRIHNTGVSETDWFNSQEINSTVVDSIIADDTLGTKIPTSIPSPFARMDLVRVAFERVARGNLDERSDNHQLVSDALDIGQILFNYRNHADKLTLEVWDKNNSLSLLLNSNNTKHKHLGNTLKLFLDQDGSQYNFDRMDKIFILKYNHKVIGGTSPRTLFFAAPGADKMDIEIEFGNDKMLDNEPLPLYRRDEEYIKYLFALKRHSDFANDFHEFNKYLDATLESLRAHNNNLYNTIHSLTNDAIRAFDDFSDPNNPAMTVNVISTYNLKQRGEVAFNSDFVIDATKEIDGKKPLVLPHGPFNERRKYTTDYWSDNIIVPYRDNTPLANRRLPQQNDLYPYLTIGDFLSDQIIKLPYSIDTSRFFTISDEEGKKYLLPLSKRFFDYFTADDLMNKRLISVKSINADNGVEVILNIPTVNNNPVPYRKIYYARSVGGDHTKGKIVELNFTIGVFPFVKAKDLQIDYTIAFGDVTNVSNISIEASNSKSNDRIEIKSRDRSKNLDDVQPRITRTYHFDQIFDVIWVNSDSTTNAVIPKLKEYQAGGDQFSFALDFGTTNTHIEYKTDAINGSDSFSIDKSDTQLIFLRDSKITQKDVQATYIREIEDYMKQELIPVEIKNQGEYQTPFRTCLLENENVSYDKETIVMGDCNIGFDYEHKSIRNYLNRKTGLKWAGFTEPANRKRVKHYIEEMLILCKNKVLVNGGDLNKTKIYWFYPVSMQKARIDMLEALWIDAFEKVFNGIPSSHLNKIPESTAPFYYYKNFEAIPTEAKPSVSIDIGGGTSDIVIFQNNKPNLITSFRFAGNSIFGDGFSGNINRNGFVQEYKSIFKNLIDANELVEEGKIFDDLINKYRSSTDFINFLFSLEKNINVRNKNQEDDINFAKYLKGNADFKIIFLLFYTALIYHVAQLLKAQGYGKPRNILFSGTGSKTLGIIDSSKNHEASTKLFQEVIDSVFNDHTDETRLQIKITPEPKKITAKGGLTDDNNAVIVPEEIISVLLSNGSEGGIVQHPYNTSEERVSFNQVDDEFEQSVVENVQQFYQLFEKLNQKLNFDYNFEMSSLSFETFKEIANDDILNYVKQGLNEKMREVGDENGSIQETLFFYPLSSLLYELGYKIFEKKNS